MIHNSLSPLIFFMDSSLLLPLQASLLQKPDDTTLLFNGSFSPLVRLSFHFHAREL